MKVLVTGSNGFIGKNLIEYFRRVRNIEIFTYSRDNNIQELEQIVQEVDFIFHLAGVIGLRMYKSSIMEILI
jgi:UDP-2-acetamido-2,6-beta-L-arabino-hexul-4-ose reductase